jgi:hypothetical protein
MPNGNGATGQEAQANSYAHRYASGAAARYAHRCGRAPQQRYGHDRDLDCRPGPRYLLCRFLRETASGCRAAGKSIIETGRPRQSLISKNWTTLFDVWMPFPSERYRFSARQCVTGLYLIMRTNEPRDRIS